MATTLLNDGVLQDKADILRVIGASQRAVQDKNAPALAAQYAGDATIYDLAPPLAHCGIDEQEKNEWFDTWDGPMEYESRDLEITVSGDFGFCHGFYRLGGNKKGVSQRVSFWMRATVVVHREDGEWRIVHEHTSVPFYMDGSLRPAFDLMP